MTSKIDKDIAKKLSMIQLDVWAEYMDESYKNKSRSPTARQHALYKACGHILDASSLLMSGKIGE